MNDNITVKSEKKTPEFGVNKTILLLSLIKKYPSLWDRNCTTDEDPRAVWEKIAKQVDSDVPTIRKKFSGIRSQYINFLSRCENNRRKNKQLPAFCWKEHICFLKDQIEGNYIPSRISNISLNSLATPARQHLPTTVPKQTQILQTPVNMGNSSQSIQTPAKHNGTYVSDEAESIFEVVDSDEEETLFEVGFSGFDLLRPPFKKRKIEIEEEKSDSGDDTSYIFTPDIPKKVKSSSIVSNVVEDNNISPDNDFVKIAKSFSGFNYLSKQRQTLLNYELRRLILDFERDLIDV